MNKKFLLANLIVSIFFSSVPLSAGLFDSVRLAVAACAARRNSEPSPQHPGLIFDDDSLECVICLEQVPVDAVYAPLCACIDKSYCRSCLKDWLARHPTCPTCRTENVKMGIRGVSDAVVCGHPCCFCKKEIADDDLCYLRCGCGHDFYHESCLKQFSSGRRVICYRCNEFITIVPVDNPGPLTI